MNICIVVGLVGLPGPGQDLLQGPALVPHPLGLQQRREPVEAAGADLPRRAGASRDDQDRLVVEDVAHGGGEAGEQGIELDVDLIAKRGVLAHQVAAVAGEQPELVMDRIRRRLDQSRSR